MGKEALVLLFWCLIVCAQSHAGHRKEKVTRLSFYVHDMFSGNTPAVVRIAQAPTTDALPTQFGAVWMADSLLTEGPQPRSKSVGRVQGFFGSAGQQEVVLTLVRTFVFTTGRYNGSGLTILGRNAAVQEFREIPVVGGTGVFRLARGFAINRAYIFNTTTLDTIIEYNVTVIH